MNMIIESTLLTLKKSKSILLKLSKKELSDASVSPYYSSIGTHIRHIFDFYDCSLKFNDKSKVDLTSRERKLSVEVCCKSSLEYYDIIINRLNNIKDSNIKHIKVIDDLGTGKIEIDYTFDALLSQANSHTIHHYAIIGYILDRLNIKIEDSGFGYNPTTPKEN